MASDNLSQLGRSLRDSKNKINFSTRKFSEDFPLIETLRDTVGILLPFRMEFFTYKKTSNVVSLNLFVQQEFDQTGRKDISEVPITITQTGQGVGLKGQVGSQGVWYPLLMLGDLNFLGSSSFTVVFDISKSGTGTFEHKIVFDGGGVDLTNVTTITADSISVSITQANVVSPPDTFLIDAYIYGRATGMSLAGWLHYDAYSVFDANGYVYTPRVFGA